MQLNKAVPLIIIFTAIYLIGLDTNGLTLPAEARIADVARTMVRTGDWVVPRFGGELRLKKPPLAYWLTAFCGLARGKVDAWSARLTGVLCAAGVLLMVYLVAAMEFSPGAGVWAMLILGSTHAFMYYARLATIEMPLLLCNLLAVLAWLWGHSAAIARGRAFAWLLVFYVCLGMGLMLKGPVGLVTVLLILGARMVLGPANADHKSWSWPWHALGILVCLGLVVPWAWALVVREPLVTQVWWHESMGRFAGVDHLRGPWYYLLVVPLDGMPWFPLLIPAVIHLRRDREKWRKIMWLLGWVGAVFVLFSIPASKKHSYVLPLYPAMAMLGGVFIDYLLSASRPDAVARAGRKILVSYAVLWVLAGGGIYWWTTFHAGVYPAPKGFAIIRVYGVLALLVAGLAGLVLALRGCTRASLLVSCAAAVLCLGLAHTSLPWYWRGRAIEQTVLKFSPGLRAYKGVVYTAGVPYLEHEVLVFYLGRRVRDLSSLKPGREDGKEIMVMGTVAVISRELGVGQDKVVPMVDGATLPKSIGWSLFRCGGGSGDGR